MDKRDLTYDHVAALLGVSRHTVHAWLKPESSKSHNEAPAAMVELLYLKCDLPLPTTRRGKSLAEVKGEEP